MVSRPPSTHHTVFFTPTPDISRAVDVKEFKNGSYFQKETNIVIDEGASGDSKMDPLIVGGSNLERISLQVEFSKNKNNSEHN